MMERVGLPGTELEVSRLCLGGNRLGAELDQDRSFALLDAFVAAGGTFLDTAHVYADWLPDVERSSSEKTIGRWLAKRNSVGAVVVATKIGHPTLSSPPVKRLDRASLRRDVAEALDNLGLARLDLVYLHRDDPDVPVGEILGVLEEIVAEGGLRYYGASNWSVARLEEAQTLAAARGWRGFVANQAEWSLARRNPGSASADLRVMDADMRAWHARHRVAAIPYSAQAKGYFDKVIAGSLDPATAQAYDSPANRRTADLLARLAQRYGVTATQLALFALTRQSVTTVPIIGPRSPEQLASSLRSLSLDPSPADLQSVIAAAEGVAESTVV